MTFGIGIFYWIRMNKVIEYLGRASRWRPTLLIGRYDRLIEIEDFIKGNPEFLRDQLLSTRLKTLKNIHKTILYILLLIAILLLIMVY